MDVNKNLKNPSADVFALRALVLTAWLFACELPMVNHEYFMLINV